MKPNKVFKSMLAWLLLALLPQAAEAYDFMVDGLCYNKNSDGTSVTVTYQNTSSPRYSNLSGNLVIPETVTYSDISYSVTSIGNYAFYGCSGLTSVTIPNSVTSIGGDAFSGCTGLTSITIPNSVTSIGAWAFQNCSGLESITVDSGNPSYDSRGNCNAIIRTSSNSLLFGCKNTVIPNSVTSIYQCAFLNCTGLTSITIPNSVTTIHINAFIGCGLESIVVENGNSTYDSRDNCNAIINTATNTLITGCKNTVIPNSVTSIGDFAFDGCRGLTSVTIPNSVTSIGNDAFGGCSGLTSVTIPNSVTSIGGSAFSNCSGLTSVTIPNSVTTIGSNTFSNCSGLTDIYTYIDNPANVTLGNNVFTSVPVATCILHVPSGTIDAYHEANQWNAFINIVEYIADASNRLWMEDFAIEPGETKSVSLMLDNDKVFTAFQLDLVLPEGISIVTKSNGKPNVIINTDRADDHQMVTNIRENGNVSILMMSLESTPIMGNSGEIVSMQFKASDTFSGTHRIELIDIELTEPDGTATKPADTYCTVTDHNEPTIVLATSITLDQIEAELTAGQTLQLTATVLPENATDKTVTWTSNDENVATVSADGLVTALAAGTATITATTVDGSNLSAICTLTVNPLTILATSVALDMTEIELMPGDTLLLTATVLPENATDKTVAWTSNDENVATVSADGLVTALAAGTATITATTVDGSNLTATCAITVVDVPSVIMGDANGDGTVNVSDYVYVANYILEQNPEPFVFAAADIDGNGEINVSDLVLVANIALTYEDPNTLNAPAPKATLNADIDMNAILYKNADGTTSITVDLNNSMDLTALQMDISLPQGMAVTGATLTDRATRSHQTEVAQLTNGSYRLLAASSTSKAFKGNEGALLTLTLSGEPQGTVTLGGIKLASPDGQCFTVNDLFLSPVVTGVDDITAQARIYGEADNIVIESPIDGMAQLVLPNGMSRTVKVKAGRNIYPAPATGLVIVRAGEKAVKLIF